VGEHMHAFREETEEDIAFPEAPAARTCEVLPGEADPSKEAEIGDSGVAEEGKELDPVDGERDL